ncbi:hypothetical protein MRX96_016945 [Rhipicephalus microplus]
MVPAIVTSSAKPTSPPRERNPQRKERELRRCAHFRERKTAVHATHSTRKARQRGSAVSIFTPTRRLACFDLFTAWYSNRDSGLFEPEAKTFFGRVPKGVSNVDICRDLVKRFEVKDIACVQDFGGGKFEVTFVSEDPVQQFKAKLEIFVGKGVVRFQYRGARTMTMRIFGYPENCPDKHLMKGLQEYGKVLEIREESVPKFESISSGVRRVRMEMEKAVPNIMESNDRLIYIEYDGVVRQCRMCYRPEHITNDCITPRCERCGKYGHTKCKQKCKRCGGTTPNRRARLARFRTLLLLVLLLLLRLGAALLMTERIL